ncbi:MAG: hypothetical protein QOD75_2416 [Blastocatellia bacterium]|nr:hypothetical protein [Blastocatellia bacterium]
MATKASPNPSGKTGKPFSLAPHSFEDALRKILATPPEPKPAPKARRPTSQKKSDKR